MSKTPVRAVETSLRVLNQLSENGVCRVTELAHRLEIPKATVYYHLKTLEENGHVKQTDQGYKLGYRALDLGGRARARHPAISVVEPRLKKLVRETNEVGVFAVEADRHAVILDVQRPGASRTEVNLTLGEHLGFHCSAVGKALLASTSKQRRAEILADADLSAHTPDTVTNRSALENRLQRISDDGLAFDRGERNPEVRGVAAPMTSLDAPTAIGIVGPASRLYDDRLENELPHLVKRFTDQIEYDIGNA